MRPRMVSRAAWIKALRRHIGVNQARFAETLNVAQPTVSRWENGAEPELQHWELLKSVALRHNFETIDERVAATVPLIGFVAAGAQVNLFSDGQGPFGEVEMPPGGSEKTVAVEVRGESMAGVADDRWIIYYEDRREPVTDDLLGRLCIVGLADGRVLIKKLAVGRFPGRFDLYSTQGAPLFDQDVTWAARVEWIKPK
jgi:DNA-binding XRE family transcriptional regulator